MSMPWAPADGKTVVASGAVLSVGGGLTGTVNEPIDLNGIGDGGGALQAVDTQQRHFRRADLAWFPTPASAARRTSPYPATSAAAAR